MNFARKPGPTRYNLIHKAIVPVVALGRFEAISHKRLVSLANNSMTKSSAAKLKPPEPTGVITVIK